MAANDEPSQLVELRSAIESEIKAAGAIPFRRFMELALYAPGLGYYERRPKAVGRRGDFYTSVSVGPVFGELLAFQFAIWREELSGGRRENWQLVEAGAHDGQLAADILAWLRQWRPALFESVEYWIVEPSLRRGEWQHERLSEFAGRVRWLGDWSERPSPWVSGVSFSNELLDAFPVRRIGWDARERRWFEWGVGFEGGRFRWLRLGLLPAAEPALPFDSVSPALLEVLPDGFTTELCPAATKWWRDAAGALERSWLLTFDYGLEGDEFFAPQRASGTVRAYRGHRHSEDVLADVGEQDLTAQANFSALRLAGESVGLRSEALEPQRRFLTRAFERTIAAPAEFPEWTPDRLRQFQTLTHPDHLGRNFRVLVQRR